MPVAHIGDVERWLQDHDADRVLESPPVQNTWYEAFDEEDVRHIWCVIRQTNDETAAKDVEIRWTIDGNVYFVGFAAAHNTYYYIFRNEVPSNVGTAGLQQDTTRRNAAYYVDKRGFEYKTEARMTSVPGTNQTLLFENLIETQEIT